MAKATSGPTALKLNGKPLQFGGPRPSASKLRAFLESLPPDELLTRFELAKRVSLAASTVEELAREWSDVKHKVARSNYYGSPKAIAELRRQLEAQS